MVEKSCFTHFVLRIRRAGPVLVALLGLESKSNSCFYLLCPSSGVRITHDAKQTFLVHAVRVTVTLQHLAGARCVLACFARVSLPVLPWSPWGPWMGTAWQTPSPSLFSLPLPPLALFIAPGRRKPHFHRRQFWWGDSQRGRGRRRKTEI